MSSCIFFDGTGNPDKASSTRLRGKADLNGLQFRLPIFIINFYYIDPNPSSVCFQRQHQGELCPSFHACSNSTYNTNNIVLETEGTTGTGLLAGRDILPNEIIAVFGNAIILQDRGLVQEFTKLINTYNMDHHPT